jgi:hypothetical protein
MPMYVKLMGLESMKKVSWQRIVIKMKDGYGVEDQDVLVERMKKQLS